MQQQWKPGAQLPPETVDLLVADLAHRKTCRMCYSSPIEWTIDDRVHALPVVDDKRSVGDSEATSVVRVSCPVYGGLQLFVADVLIKRLTVQ